MLFFRSIEISTASLAIAAALVLFTPEANPTRAYERLRKQPDAAAMLWHGHTACNIALPLELLVNLHIYRLIHWTEIEVRRQVLLSGLEPFRINLCPMMQQAAKRISAQ